MNRMTAVILVCVGTIFMGIAIAIASIPTTTSDVGRRKFRVKIVTILSTIGIACWMSIVLFPPAE